MTYGQISAGRMQSNSASCQLLMVLQVLLESPESLTAKNLCCFLSYLKRILHKMNAFSFTYLNLCCMFNIHLETKVLAHLTIYILHRIYINKKKFGVGKIF